MWVDVCGVCNGDEGNCARRRTPATCHAVGDPHYRTFDGFTFNYQVSGEFTLVKHLNDFEVQNKQRVCPNPDVRCNMAIAVKASGHILIFYADWGTGRMLFDGVARDVPQNQRVTVNDDLTYTVNGNSITIRYTDATVRAYINPWAWTYYMDLYIDSPSRWSSGRSLTGLCWTNDGDYNDDSNVLNVAAQFWVGDSPRSLFSNPRPTETFATQGSVALLAAEHDQQSALAALNGPKGAMMLVEEPPNHHPHHNIELAFKNEAEKQRIETACSTAHGHDKRDCMFDMLAGEPEGPAASAAEIANLIDHEKLLQECAFMRSAPAASFNDSRIPDSQHNEGYSFAFWYVPMLPATAEVRSIIGKGTPGNYEVRVTMPANTLKLTVRMGNAECTVPTPLVVNTWAHVAFTVTYGGGLTVWINGQISCTNDGGSHVDQGTNRLFIGEIDMPIAVGRMGRFYYVPTTFTGTMVNRYASRTHPSEDACPTFNVAAV